ncbi:uncharacterized protein B4U79_03991 [Dinothrombium tinctorium]|uniref:GH18 domain-containing protein n=1 Tax=Dinothrombium tinctorium TaxID=1965070 RepID=A0A3S3PLX3_9ACAR|nr:uncharacterized protein B4U79_03991 [Dinothrombium tinctorium]
MILQCALAKSITPTVVNFWNDLLTNPSKGPQWPYDFKDGVVSSDEPKLADEQASLRVRSSPECNKKVIASVINSIDKLNQDLIVNSVTHLVYSFINVHSNGSLSFGNNSKNSYSLLYKMISLREKKPELKLIFAIGGWDNSEHFSYIAANPSIQRVFISDLIAFLDYWKFDGIDITWQYPVVGGKKPGFKADRENYVMLLKNIREAFNVHLSTQPELLTDKLSLSITAPGAFWIVEQGYDLNRIIDVVDWVNVLAFDYFGAYKSAWGTYTGPIAPLYFGAPDGFPGKLNVEATMKKYACETRKANKIVMGVPFYGRFWKNVGNPVKNEDDLYRTSQSIGGFPDGGTITYDEIKVKFRKESDEKEIFHEKTQTPYSWNKIKKTLISYENERSIAAKVNYAINHNLGGIFIWSLNFDDSNSSLLNAVSQNFHCQPNFSEYKCSEIKEKRWWTQYDVNGFYPICDPDDPGYSCCGTYGFCGSGAEFCECKGCIDYGKMPEKALIEPIKPSQALRWHTLNASLNGSTPKCGPKAPKLIDGQIPICNPDANDSYCCSSSGYCGAGSSYCQCKDCVDFRANPNHVYQQKMWWGWDDGPEVAGRCGLRAPKINGQYPICDPDSRSSYCCGYTGYCGSGRSFCDCPNCVNFKTNPTFRW